ncbi:MAG: potassium-transporting ATPase subunit KdpC [Chthoniobacterales bacterium]
MLKSIIISLRALLLLTVICGIIYPLFITGIAQTFFKSQSGGSLIKQDADIVGSELIAQPFKKASYFWVRPSAADYATVPSGAANQSFTSKKLQDAVLARAQAFGKSDLQEVPSDLLLSSGSGLDPHISPEAAFFQLPRVAKARKLTVAELQNIVTQSIESPQFGVFGDSRVNVLLLNRILDTMALTRD